MKPGGWLESYEMKVGIETDDGSIQESSACKLTGFRPSRTRVLTLSF